MLSHYIKVTNLYKIINEFSESS